MISVFKSFDLGKYLYFYIKFMFKICSVLDLHWYPLNLNLIKNENNQFNETKTNTCSHKAFNGTVVNRTLSSLPGESLEILKR